MCNKISHLEYLLWYAALKPGLQSNAMHAAVIQYAGNKLLAKIITGGAEHSGHSFPPTNEYNINVTVCRSIPYLINKEK